MYDLPKNFSTILNSKITQDKKMWSIVNGQVCQNQTRLVFRSNEKINQF